ncbi:GNAT family N-acetyltransferase [Pontibacter korlensis]|uniref:GNAT family N-acetyltransferase n=1 Tax=Pontibacter korlensis TaxID=400092 RepID=UPI00061B1782|nr:GNAT family N-acetyltransferase [Pontibacter korlensis]
MPNFHFSFLTPQSLPQLHSTFLKAFADYVVPIQLSEEQFKDKIEREGVVVDFSVGVFVGKEMVGFILTGLGEWQGKPAAYNAGTGVVPGYRGHQLTQRMYEFMLPKLRESGIELCLLEVIQENIPALRSYERIGFKATRSLLCFRAMKEDLLLQQVEEPTEVIIKPAIKPSFKVYQSYLDVAPTWQNDMASLKRSKGQNTILEALNAEQEVVGYISFFIKNGAVAQLAVDKQWRRKGVATALLREAVKQVQAPSIMFINIESTAKDVVSYLERRHFKLILKQYEMVMPIV